MLSTELFVMQDYKVQHPLKQIQTRSQWRLKRLRAEPLPVTEPCISQGHVIKGSWYIIGRSKGSYHSTEFGCHRHSCNRDMMVFVYHVTLQDHMIKALYDFMIRSLSRYITILASLVAIDIVVVEI